MTDLERDKWPDPVKRVKDEMDMHAVAGGFGYAVFSLQTGIPVTHDLYPSRARARLSAEKRTSDHLLILEVSPDGMPYNEADAVLRYERALVSAGFRSPDTLETEENSGLLSMPRTKADKKRMIRQLLSGRPLVPEGMPYGNLPSELRKVNLWLLSPSSPRTPEPRRSRRRARLSGRTRSGRSSAPETSSRPSWSPEPPRLSLTCSCPRRLCCAASTLR